MNLSCSELSDLIPLYLAGELDAGEINKPQAARFAAHLAVCPRCAAQVAEMTALDDQLRVGVLTEPIETGALERQVLHRIALEAEPRRRSVWNWGLAAGLAAAALASVVGLRLAFPPKPIGLLAAAARDHRTEIVDRQPRKWQSDLASASALAASRGIRSSLITAVAGTGYAFKEARLCRLDGFVFLHLVYTDGGREFSVFLRQEDGGVVNGTKHAGRPRDSTGGNPIYTADLGGEHTAGFMHGTLKAMIVTESPGDAALHMAQTAASVL
jgi:anti-sigma factor RsiW